MKNLLSSDKFHGISFVSFAGAPGGADALGDGANVPGGGGGGLDGNGGANAPGSGLCDRGTDDVTGYTAVGSTLPRPVPTAELCSTFDAQ